MRPKRQGYKARSQERKGDNRDRERLRQQRQGARDRDRVQRERRSIHCAYISPQGITF